MTRRDLFKAATSVPALGAAVQDVTPIDPATKVVTLTLSPHLDPHNVKLDKDTVVRAFEEAFEEAGLEAPQVIVLMGLQVARQD